MASLKENLIAARALIDTPEKWVAAGSVQDLMFRVTGIPDGGTAFRALVDQCGKGERRPEMIGFDRIMALFDRAIAAAEATP